MTIQKYDSWLARDESDIDGDIQEFNDCLISELMSDICSENYETLNELSHSMLDDICNMSSPLLKEEYDFSNVKTDETITNKKRTIAKACIDDKQGNVPVSFAYNGNIDTDLILTILANFSSKICEEYNGEDITCMLPIITNYTEITTILDYYNELFKKLEQYYLNIDNDNDLYKLYENFYLMTKGVLSFHKGMNIDDLKKFKNNIVKNYKFLKNCLEHIKKTYEVNIGDVLTKTLY